MAVKYFCDDWPTNAARLAFEKSIFTKTQKTNARTEGNLASPGIPCSSFFNSNRFSIKISLKGPTFIRRQGNSINYALILFTGSGISLKESWD